LSKTFTYTPVRISRATSDNAGSPIYSVHLRVYTPGKGWGIDGTISSGTDNTISSWEGRLRMAIDPSGGAVVTWLEESPSLNNLLANVLKPVK
jgi:hypothetical protein